MNTPDEFDNTESLLRSLSPAPAAIDHDRLMFDAGRAAGRRGARLWQGCSGVLAAALLCMIALPAAMDESARVAGVVSGSADRPPTTPTVASGGTGGAAVEAADGLRPEPPSEPDRGALAYVELRRRVLQSGLDALPRPEKSGHNGRTPEPLTPQQWREWMENTL